MSKDKSKDTGVNYFVAGVSKPAQNAELAAAQARVAELEAKVSDLEAKVAELEAAQTTDQQ